MTSSFTLRPFQRRVYHKVMSGQSVILQAPTGAGKTRAALMPFIEHLVHYLAGRRSDCILPLTCRYAVPLRVLAQQFYREYHTIAAKIDQRYATKLETRFADFGQHPIAIQTGEQSDDPQFEAALTFCTIDQLLASGLGVPYGIGERRANLNVAAVLNSYLVLDEFHLFPFEKDRGARLTTLQLLRMARLRRERSLVPFVLMTATFSNTLLKQLAALLEAEIVSVLPERDCQANTQKDEPDELATLNAGRVRIFYRHDTPLDVAAVLAAHRDSSLVVCNTVRRSQMIYRALREQVTHEGRATQVFLLHSRFTPADRHWLQAQLEATLGKDAWKNQHQRDVIVVTTQVLEVGLDISATCLHTEVAPANSLIQRAGRCARFEGQHGTVHVYPLADEISTRPYDPHLCDATWQTLAAYNGQHVDFAAEQHLINAVHTTEDEQMLDILQRQEYSIRKTVIDGWSARDESIGKLRSELIRDVQQVSILIHPDPQRAITRRPWQWESFGMHPGTLMGAWKTLEDWWQELGDGGPFCRKPLPEETSTDDEAGERLVPRYRWEPVSTAAEVLYTAMVALPPELATYDSPRQGGGLGFLLREAATDAPDALPWPASGYQSQHDDRETRGRYRDGYEQESYVEHITGLLRAYQQTYLQQQMRYPAQVLEEVLGLPTGIIDRAIRLAIACHDIGKLGSRWQTWCERWQTVLARERGQRYAIQPDKRPFAHTDYDGSLMQRELQRTIKPPRPHHACESAELAAFFIEETLIAGTEDEKAAEVLARATVAAIARHHAAGSLHYSPMTLCADALAAIQAGLEIVRQGQHWAYDVQQIDQSIPNNGEITPDKMTLPKPTNVTETLLYFLLVRVLRLADQRSFRYKG